MKNKKNKDSWLNVIFKRPEKVVPTRGFISTFWNKYLSRQSVILRKYGKDFLFCFSNYPFLLSVSYFLALNIVHQRSPPSVFPCKLFVNQSVSATQRKCRHSASRSIMCGINSTYWSRIWNQKSNKRVFRIILTVHSYSWYMVNRKHPILESVRLWWAVCYGLLRVNIYSLSTVTFEKGTCFLLQKGKWAIYGPEHIQTAFSAQFDDSCTWMPLADTGIKKKEESF